MAGIDFSYTIPKNILPIRIYGQLIGEDESGNLSSCFIYMLGAVLTFSRSRFPTNFGVEKIDTSAEYTTNNNCGTNTAYNNGIYTLITIKCLAQILILKINP